jgi:hypothetical protein
MCECMRLRVQSLVIVNFYYFYQRKCLQNKFVLSNYSNTLPNMTSRLEVMLQVIGYELMTRAFGMALAYARPYLQHLVSSL